MSVGCGSWLLCLSILTASDQKAPHIKAAVLAYQDAKAAIHQQNWPAAEKGFLQAIAIEPTYAEAYRSLIDLYFSRERLPDAGLMLTRLLQFEPKSVPDRLRLGRLLLAQQQWPKAAAQFSLALKIDSENSEALYGFAVAADRSGMPDRALEAVERGLKQFPRDSRFGALREQLQSR